MTPETSGSQTHHREVAQPNPSDTRAYLEQLTKAVFIAGLNWKVVESKWPGFLEAFHGFDPRYVANLSRAAGRPATPLGAGHRACHLRNSRQRPRPTSAPTSTRASTDAHRRLPTWCSSVSRMANTHVSSSSMTSRVPRSPIQVDALCAWRSGSIPEDRQTQFGRS
jgi:hypothetical protein